jgi:hypothetical protein
VAVEERAADTPVEDAGERLVMRLGRPRRHELVPFGMALDAQTLLVRGSAAEAAIRGSVAVLEALHAPMIAGR